MFLSFLEFLHCHMYHRSVPHVGRKIRQFSYMFVLDSSASYRSRVLDFGHDVNLPLPC